MPQRDPPAASDSFFPGKAGALLIDLTLLGAIVYAGRVIAAGVALYIDDLIRQVVIGTGWAKSLDELRSQIRAHPLLLGRPVLFDVLCSDLGPAALLLVYAAFIRTQCDGVTPGAMLLRPAARAQIKHAASGLFAQLADLVAQKFQSWMPANRGASNLRQRLNNLRDLFAPARTLPAGSRAVGLAALALAAAATAATPIVYAFNHVLAQAGFENAYGKPALVAQISVYLSLAAIAVGWAAALVGASMTNLLVLVMIGPIYVFNFVFVGLVTGRAWWLAVPQWSLPVLAAMTPASPRRWPARLAVLWALCSLAVLHSFRLTPLHTFTTWSSWRIVLPLGLLAAAVIGRLRRRPPPGALFVSLLAVNGAFVAAALRAGLAPITANVNESLYQLAGVLTLFWFFLGTNLVGGCVGLAGSVVSTAYRLCAERWLPSIVVGLCLAELFVIGELMRFNPGFMHETRLAGQNTIRLSTLPAHQGIAIAILLIAALCAAAGGLTPGRARGLLGLWGFSLFLIWAFFLSGIPLLSAAGASPAQSGATLRQGFTLLQGIEKRLGGEKQFVAIGLVTFTLLWEVFAGARREGSPDGPWAQAPGALILYVGLLALLAALTHFALVSATMSPLAADAYMYSGMQALWLPIALYAAWFAQRQVPPCDRGILIRAFFIGMLAATPVCFQRVLMGDPARIGLWPNSSVVAASEAIILVCMILGLRSAPTLRAIDAAAAGVACALGFAVAYTQGLIAPLLSQFAGIVSALTGFSSAPGVVRSWLAPTRWNVVPQSDLLIFYLAVPASAGAAAIILWKARQRGRPGSEVLTAPAIFAATVVYTAPLYANRSLRMPFSPAAAATLTPAVYCASIAWLAPLVIAAAGYIYARAWRPAATPAPGRDQA